MKKQKWTAEDTKWIREGIEPSSPRCKRGVFPLDDRPRTNPWPSSDDVAVGEPRSSSEPVAGARWWNCISDHERGRRGIRTLDAPRRARAGSGRAPSTSPDSFRKERYKAELEEREGLGSRSARGAPAPRSGAPVAQRWALRVFEEREGLGSRSARGAPAPRSGAPAAQRWALRVFEEREGLEPSNRVAAIGCFRNRCLAIRSTSPGEMESSRRLELHQRPCGRQPHALLLSYASKGVENGGSRTRYHW